jgi:hypothetical protein
MLLWRNNQKVDLTGRAWAAARNTGIIFLGTWLFGAATAFAGVNVPDWVRQAAIQPLASYPPDTQAVVLLDQTDYTILNSGDYIEHSRNVIRVLRPTGRDERYLGVGLERKDKLQSIHGWTIDNVGRNYELKEKDFNEVSRFPTWILYEDTRSLVAKPPAILPGSVIAFEYEVHRQNGSTNWGGYFRMRFQ